MITPDQVRGHHRTLNQAVRKGGWPTLAQARGKVIFLMDQARVGPTYLEGHPGLRGRVLFTNATPGHPDAAFIEENDGNPARIASLVRQGYLVRRRRIPTRLRREPTILAAGTRPSTVEPKSSAPTIPSLSPPDGRGTLSLCPVDCGTV